MLSALACSQTVQSLEPRMRHSVGGHGWCLALRFHQLPVASDSKCNSASACFMGRPLVTVSMMTPFQKKMQGNLMAGDSVT